MCVSYSISPAGKGRWVRNHVKSPVAYKLLQIPSRDSHFHYTTALVCVHGSILQTLFRLGAEPRKLEPACAKQGGPAHLQLASWRKAQGGGWLPRGRGARHESFSGFRLVPDGGGRCDDGGGGSVRFRCH